MCVPGCSRICRCSLLYVTTRLLACQHPFLLIDLTVTVQIETLQKFLLVGFPCCLQIGDILFQVEIAVRAADGRELADRVFFLPAAVSAILYSDGSPVSSDPCAW